MVDTSTCTCRALVLCETSHAQQISTAPGHYHNLLLSQCNKGVVLSDIIIYKQGGSLHSPHAAPDLDTFHHIATYLHTYTCML